MPVPLESKAEQIKVIEENVDKIIEVARQGYRIFQEKGTIIILRQLNNDNLQLEDWQIKYKPLGLIANTISDWKQTGLQDLLIKYNPEISLICTFLYPNGAHTSYHFSVDRDNRS